MNDADVFFSNRRPGYQERFGLTADELCSKHPGLIHAKVVLHGETGPWSNRTGFDEVAGAVTGVFALEGTADNPRLPQFALYVTTSWVGLPQLVSCQRFADVQLRAEATA